MHVAIDDDGAADESVALHPTNRDGDIVDETEAFSVIGESVVESATDMDADSVVKGVVGGENGASGHQPKGFRKLGTEGDFEFELFASGEQAFADLLEVQGCVDEENVFVTGRLRCYEIGSFGGLELQKAIVRLLVLVGGKNVGADG